MREAADGVDASPPVPAVEVDGLVKTFSEPFNRVLGGIGFTIGPAETVAIVGPSGFGKSTLLNIVAGLLAPTAGLVRILGQPVAGPQSGVGYLTQKDTLLPWRTAVANVELPLTIKGVAKDARRELAMRALSQVGLEGAEKRYPAHLSGGMRRRVSLARMLVVEPHLLLLDEPFSALDAQLRAMLQQELARIVETLRRPALLVTHDLGEALTLGDRVLVLSGRPATITAVVEVPFGRPRSVADVRSDPGFGRLEKRLWEEIGNVPG